MVGRLDHIATGCGGRVATLVSGRYSCASAYWGDDLVLAPTIPDDLLVSDLTRRCAPGRDARGGVRALLSGAAVNDAPFSPLSEVAGRWLSEQSQ